MLDLQAAKRLLLEFERRRRDNLEEWMTHPHDPSWFVDSKLVVHAKKDRLFFLDGAPELFPDLILLVVEVLLPHRNAEFFCFIVSHL